MAAAIPFVMAGLQVVNAVGQYRTAKQNAKVQAQYAQHSKDVAYANAKIAEKQGDRAMAAASSRGQAKYREGKLRESRALAVGAQSGLGMSESFINMLSDIGSMTRFNAEAEIYGGKSDRRAKLHEGQLMQWRGDIDYEQGMYKSRAMKSQAKANLVGGIVGAMGTLYGGMSGGAGAGGGNIAPVTRGMGMPAAPSSLAAGYSPAFPGADMGRVLR